MSIEVPDFTWVYAFIIALFLLGCISLFKPKHDYKPFTIGQFDNQCCPFCLARVQWWTVRFIFYYVKPMVAGPLFIATIILISVLSAIRLDDGFYELLDDIKDMDGFSCTDTSVTGNLKDYANSSIIWSDQLTWMLTIYFFQKLFGATLFLNGGGLASIASMIFDPWLYFSVIWCTILYYDFANLVTSSEFKTCYDDTNDNDLLLFSSLETTLSDLNAFCIILWILCALSLPFGILIDYGCTVVREWNEGMVSGGNGNVSVSDHEKNLEKQQDLNTQS